MNTWNYNAWISEVKSIARNNHNTKNIPSNELNLVIESFSQCLNNQYNEGFSPSLAADCEVFKMRWNAMSIKKESEFRDNAINNWCERVLL